MLESKEDRIRSNPRVCNLSQIPRFSGWLSPSLAWNRCCSPIDPLCQASEYRKKKLIRVQLASPTFTEFAKYHPWFMFSVAFPPESDMKLTELTTLRGKDIILQYFTQLWNYLFYLKLWLKKKNAAYWHVPDQLFCFFDRRDDIITAIMLLLVPLAGCIAYLPTFDLKNVLLWMCSPKWMFELVKMVFTSRFWYGLARYLDQGIAKFPLSRLYGPGTWLLFLYSSSKVCGLEDLLINTVRHWKGSITVLEQRRRAEASKAFAEKVKLREEAKEREKEVKIRSQQLTHRKKQEKAVWSVWKFKEEEQAIATMPVAAKEVLNIRKRSYSKLDHFQFPWATLRNCRAIATHRHLPRTPSKVWNRLLDRNNLSISKSVDNLDKPLPLIHGQTRIPDPVYNPFQQPLLQLYIILPKKSTSTCFAIL